MACHLSGVGGDVAVDARARMVASGATRRVGRKWTAATTASGGRRGTRAAAARAPGTRTARTRSRHTHTATTRRMRMTLMRATPRTAMTTPCRTMHTTMIMQCLWVGIFCCFMFTC